MSRQQTALVYGFPGVKRSAPDRYALVVLENIVSGLGGRFFDAIREKQGLAYTVRTANAFYSQERRHSHLHRVLTGERRESSRLAREGIRPTA